jgi:hypothetical protein
MQDTTTPETQALKVLDPNCTEHWMEVHAAGCTDLRKNYRGGPKGAGAWSLKAASLMEAAEVIASDFLNPDDPDAEPVEAYVDGHIHFAPCVTLPRTLNNNHKEQTMTTTETTPDGVSAEFTATATATVTPPETTAALDRVLPETPAEPTTVQWYLNGKAVGESMNRLSRVGTFYTHHIVDKPGYEQYGHGKPWLNSENFVKLVHDLGVQDISKDFEVTLPNGNVIAVRYGQGGSPVSPPKARAEKAPKAAKKTTAKPNAERLAAMNAELAAVAEWKANGEQGDKPATPLNDARNAEIKAQREAKAAEREARLTAAAPKAAAKKDAEVTPITKASQTRRTVAVHEVREDGTVNQPRRVAKKAETAKRAEIVTKAAHADAEVAAAEDKIADLVIENAPAN